MSAFQNQNLAQQNLGQNWQNLGQQSNWEQRNLDQQRNLGQQQWGQNLGQNLGQSSFSTVCYPVGVQQQFGASQTLKTELPITEHIEIAPVVHEKIRREEVQEIQPIIHREREKTEIHKLVQPLYTSTTYQ